MIIFSIFATILVLFSQGFLNGQLFLIKHMLILREQTTPFRGTCAVKEASMDFSKYKSLASFFVEKFQCRPILFYLLDSAMHIFKEKSRWFSLGSSNVLLEFLLQVGLF